MAKCDVCGKGVSFGRKISITRSQVSRRALSQQKPNVRRVHVVQNGTPKTKHVCSRCLRSGAVERAQHMQGVECVNDLVYEQKSVC